MDLNPLLRGAELLLVKRYTYNSKHYYDDFQHISAWGGNLCVLSLADGRVRELVPQLAGGVFDRYDLSFDGRRIVFGYRRPQARRLPPVRGRRGRQRPAAGDVSLRPMRTAGSPPTAGRATATASTACRAISSGPTTSIPATCPTAGSASPRPAPSTACCVRRRITWPARTCSAWTPTAAACGRCPTGRLSEFTPTMMEDGRILYNRWEYVYKGIAAIQPLWTTRPDGSGGEEFYGDNIANPGVFWQARQVPGHPQLAVCLGCGHEPLGVGQVLLLDLSKSKRTPEPITNLTPDVKIQNLRGIFHLRNGVWREDFYGPLYSDPVSAVRQVLPGLVQPGPALQRPGRLRHLPAGRLRQPRADLPRPGDLVLAADAAAASPDAAGASRMLARPSRAVLPPAEPQRPEASTPRPTPPSSRSATSTAGWTASRRGR